MDNANYRMLCRSGASRQVLRNVSGLPRFSWRVFITTSSRGMRSISGAVLSAALAVAGTGSTAPAGSSDRAGVVSRACGSQKEALESLQHSPGRVLPARPARCLAEAMEMGCSKSNIQLEVM